MFNIYLGLCIYFVQKSVKMIRKSFIKMENIFNALPFSAYNAPSRFYDLILAWSECY